MGADDNVASPTSVDIATIHMRPKLSEMAAAAIKPEDQYVDGRRSRDRDNTSMADRYPKYYKCIPANVSVLDVYAVCQMFPVQDDTGCINHARKKLLVPGTRTGGKSFYDDIKEARDTLNRWLELNAGHTGAVKQAEVVKK